MTSDDDLPRIRYSEDEESEPETTALVPISAIETTVPQVACLIAVAGQRSVGKTFKLRAKKSIVGRALGSDVQLAEDGVSRRHAEAVRVTPSRIALRDLGSSNGIIYRGQRVKQVMLQEGDRVQLGDAALCLVFMDDVAEAIEDNLFESATIDPITRLPNRRQMLATLADDLAYAARYGETVSLCLLAIDQAKDVHDAFGPSSANGVIRRLARISRDLASSEEACVARYSEEELGIVLPDTVVQQACTFAESVRRAVESIAFQVKGDEVRLTLSAGVATGSSTSAQELASIAESNLYRAIVAGRNRIEPPLTVG